RDWSSDVCSSDLKELRKGERVEGGLEDLASADHHPGLGADLAGLVVRGAERAVGRALHQIDGSADPESFVEDDGIERAPRIALAPLGKAEGKLEAPGLPGGLLRDAQEP